MMSLPAAVDHTRSGWSRLLTLVAIALVAAGLGTAAAVQVMNGSLVAALCLIPYLGLLCAVWWLSRGNVLVLVMVAYLIAPSPADNLLPQVFIFASTDYALRARDLLFLADLVLVGALLLLRPPLPAGRLARTWLVALLLLAAYPVVVGLVAGVGQSVPAVLQGAVMPLRGVGMVVLVTWWARTRGWDAAVRDLGRTLVLAAGLIALAEVALLVLARGELNFSLFNYPLVTDGRPAVPGWGNNILANFFCSCLAVITFWGHRLGWRVRWRVALAVLLVIGLAYTEVRIAMMLALLIIETPVVLALVRWLWPRRGAVLALVTGVVVGAALALTTVTLLYKLNPRFETLLPGFLSEYIVTEEVDQTVAPPSSGDVVIDPGGESLSTRGQLLRAAVDVWSRSPVVGTGWNGWGWAKGEGEYHQPIAVDPHNGFTWLLADTGVLGVLLLYLVPLALAWRRWDLWWLLAVPGVATMLEMVNPNLRNGHFAVLVWASIALAFAAQPPEQRYTILRWLRDAWDWVRGREPQPIEGDMVQSEAPATGSAATEPAREPDHSGATR